MKPVWINKTTGQNRETELYPWLQANSQKNNVDWDVLEYPATEILTATDGEKNILHVPIQRCYFVESLGISPDASPLEVVKALYGVMQIVRYASIENGQREIYFLGSDTQTNEFAEKHGFERVNLPVYRMKI